MSDHIAGGGKMIPRVSADALEIDRQRRQIAVLRETLLGVRGMAEIERASGSRTWGRAIALIDAALADTGEESP